MDDLPSNFHTPRGRSWKKVRFPWNAKASCALHYSHGLSLPVTVRAFSAGWIRLISATVLEPGNQLIAELVHPERGVRCTVPMRVTRAGRQPDGMFELEGVFARELTNTEMVGLL